MNHFDELLEYHKQKALEGDKFSREVVAEWEMINTLTNEVSKYTR